MSRRFLVPALFAVLLAGGLALLYGALFSPASAPRYRTAKVERGAIVSAVSASGAVNAVTTVIVGSQLSGQIAELLADFNSEVKAGQLIARLDTDQIEARQRQARADLEVAQASAATQQAQIERARSDLGGAQAAIANAHAQVDRASIGLKDAERELRRKRDLAARGAVSAADLDRAQTAADQARAQLVGAEAQQRSAAAAAAGAEASLRMAEAQLQNALAQIRQREAAVRLVEVDLERAHIRSPIDGVVVQRNVDVGQTVAASLQAPTLFTIAQDLRQMQVHASIDEADIGRVRLGQPVTFTVDAFPGQNFGGEVQEIRKAPQVVQNVVSYVVLISAGNPDLRLLPGMTANVRIIIDQRTDAVKVPNAALRFRPAPAGAAAGGGGDPAGASPGAAQAEAFAQRVIAEVGLDEEQQRALREIMAENRRTIGAAVQGGGSPDERRQQIAAMRQRTAERIEALLRPEQKPRFAQLRANARGAQGPVQGRVWILRPGRDPGPVPVRLGISDGSHTEVVSGDVAAGQVVVTGVVEAAPPPATPGLRF